MVRPDDPLRIESPGPRTAVQVSLLVPELPPECVITSVLRLWGHRRGPEIHSESGPLRFLLVLLSQLVWVGSEDFRRDVPLGTESTHRLEGTDREEGPDGRLPSWAEGPMEP